MGSFGRFMGGGTQNHTNKTAYRETPQHTSSSPPSSSAATPLSSFACPGRRPRPHIQPEARSAMPTPGLVRLVAAAPTSHEALPLPVANVLPSAGHVHTIGIMSLIPASSVAESGSLSSSASSGDTSSSSTRYSAASSASGGVCSALASSCHACMN